MPLRDSTDLHATPGLEALKPEIEKRQLTAFEKRNPVMLSAAKHLWRHADSSLRSA